jgi:carbonic anhydrase
MQEKTNLTRILEANERMLANRVHEDYQTSKFPDKRMLILTCMDTRLVEFLERAMGIRHGEAIIVRVAGAQVCHPFDSAMRSILVASNMLQVDEIAVVGHHDCGIQRLDKEAFVEKMRQRDVSDQTIRLVERAGVKLEDWLCVFDDVYQSVRHSVSVIRNHPFLEKSGIPVHGLVIDPHTGKLELVVDGYRSEHPMEIAT